MVALPAPTIVLIFGPNCSGKSTAGRALAARIDRCALIEIDELHHMIVGGLVAYSAGAKPWTEPDEYRRQCDLALRAGMELARSFAGSGFSCVLTALDDACAPPSTWSRDSFPGLPVYTVALLCEEQALRERWRERGWAEDGVLDATLHSLASYRAKAALFDCAVDTTNTDAERTAEVIVGRLAGAAG